MAQLVARSVGSRPCRVRQRAVATAPKVNATAIRTTISHTGTLEVLATEMAGDEPLWRCSAAAGPGRISKPRRDRAPASLATCFASRKGSLTASAGSPGRGVWAPAADGIVSQYWFSALSAGLVQPGTVAALAGNGARALSARTTTAMRRNGGIPDLIPGRCYPISQS